MPREVLDRLLEATTMEGPRGDDALEFLQAVYRDVGQPLGVRIRCAVEALPFEKPKLASVTNIHLEGSFAQLLDRAIERSNRAMKLIEHVAQPVPSNTKPSQISSDVMRKPFPQMRRRV